MMIRHHFHRLLSRGNETVVELLLDNGAHIEVKGSY